MDGLASRYQVIPNQGKVLKKYAINRYKNISRRMPQKNKIKHDGRLESLSSPSLNYPEQFPCVMLPVVGSAGLGL